MKDVLDDIDAHVAVAFGRSLWRPAVPDATGALADFHRVVDGCVDGVSFEAFELLDIAEAAAERATTDRVAVDEAWPTTWWSPTWHPFASDRAGQLLVVDADTGRVLAFLHDDDGRPLRLSTSGAVSVAHGVGSHLVAAPPWASSRAMR